MTTVSDSGEKKRGRPRRQPVLDAAAITEAAVRLADSNGIEAVSIRRLAAELDARAMSLYDHFSSKDEVLSSMANRAVEEVLVPGPLPPDWREAVTAIATRLYVTLVSHPWLTIVLSERPRFGPNATKLARQMLAATEELPLPEDRIWVVLGIVNDYVLGHSLRAVTKPDESELRELIPKEDLVETEELASLPDYLRTRASVTRFEEGLETTLDGIERRFLEG